MKSVAIPVIARCRSRAFRPSGTDSPIRRRLVRFVALPAVLTVLAGGCFYTSPSPLLPAQPGTIIKTEPVTISELHGTALRVMYHSRSATGTDVPVTGMIYTPNGAPGPNGRPVVSWAHGSKGFADLCAQSWSGAVLPPPEINKVLDRGAVLVATDYEGLGTIGEHPKGVGEAEAHGAIDIVRAARNLPSVDAGAKYVVWGTSQGGRATAFAWHIAETYAPDLDLVGAVGLGIPSNLDELLPEALVASGPFHVMVAAAGINAAFGDTEAPLDEVLTPVGIADIAARNDNANCTSELRDMWSELSVSSVLVQQADGTYNPMSNPTWHALLADEDAANFTSASDAPLLIVQGGEDDVVPASTSDELATQLCNQNLDVQRWLYGSDSHTSVKATSMDNVLDWMTHRFLGQPWPDPMNLVSTPAHPASVTASCQ